MREKVTIKKVCPCCKYEYWTNEKQGKKDKDDFIPINVIGENGDIVTIAVECPKCGIHVNPRKCTTKEKKEI